MHLFSFAILCNLIFLIVAFKFFYQALKGCESQPTSIVVRISFDVGHLAPTPLSFGTPTKKSVKI